jgi:hypothetical protein
MYFESAARNRGVRMEFVSAFAIFAALRAASALALPERKAHAKTQRAQRKTNCDP